MENDYTWRELSKLLFYEMNPQTGYTDMLSNQHLRSKYNIPDNGYEVVHRYDTDFNRYKNRPQIKVNIPNQNLLINGEDFRVGAQPQFYQDYIKSRLGNLYDPEMELGSASKRLKLVSPNNKNLLRTWGVSYGRNNDFFKIPMENIKRTTTPWQRFTNRIPTDTMGMMANKFMGYPLVRYGSSLLGRASVPLMIWEGLNSPVARDEDMLPQILEGGIEYNDYR